MKTFLTALFALAMVVSTAKAQESSELKEVKASELYAVCKDVSDTTPPATVQTALNTGECNGYLTGWSETITSTVLPTDDSLNILVLADGTTTPKLRRAFNDFMKAHPSKVVAQANAEEVVLAVALKVGMVKSVPVSFQNEEESNPKKSL